ncbi:RING-H2 finger protein ATL72 [Linum grandiflorum]
MTRILLHSSAFSSPPPNAAANSTNATTTTHDPYINERDFDANMVIILAALLCALIGALGLNSIIRCAMRCGITSPPPTAAGISAAKKGLKKRDLKQIPVAVYGSGEEGMPAVTECSICLGEFSDGEKVRVLPKCNHGFHVECVDKWLQSRSSCPNCRMDPRDRRGVGGSGGGGGSCNNVDVVV